MRAMAEGLLDLRLPICVLPRSPTLLLLLLYFMQCLTDGAPPNEVEEVCFTEHFHARCTQHHVIVMKRALYGRMQLGRCIPEDHETIKSIGCQSDVLELAERKCSGRRICSIKIPDPEFEATDPCRHGMVNYLETIYTCLPVAVATLQLCEVCDIQTIRSPSSGFIASLTTRETGCGYGRCPWVIEAAQGQKVQLSVIDFAEKRVVMENVTMEDEEPWRCQRQADIEEPDLLATKTVCRGRDRERMVYTSLGRQISVRLPANLKDPAYYLVKYEFIGCADLVAGGGVQFRREGVNAFWVCETTGEQVPLKCNGSQWSGTRPDCQWSNSAAKGLAMSDRESILQTAIFSWDMVLITCGILSFLMAVTLLVAALYQLKKRTRKNISTLVAVQDSRYDDYCLLYEVQKPQAEQEKKVNGQKTAYKSMMFASLVAATTAAAANATATSTCSTPEPDEKPKQFVARIRTRPPPLPPPPPPPSSALRVSDSLRIHSSVSSV